jgi:PAS domain-containing protein
VGLARSVALFSPAIIEQWSPYLSIALIGLLAYQQWRLYQLRKRTVQREELFRIVAENAADMIALVDVKGRRLYNSPAYEKVLGY